MPAASTEPAPAAAPPAPPATHPDRPLAAAEWRALGTDVRLVVTDPRQLGPGRSLLEAELAALDAACSRFRPDSELRSLDDAGGRPVPVSPLLAGALAAALRAARLTGGLVDPTVGEAMAAIGYDRDYAQVPADGPALALRVRPVPGWRQVALDHARRVVTVPAGVRLDLGAVAKAFAADRAAALLGRRLGCGVLVGLGGDLAFAGPVPVGGWTVRVQDVPTRISEPPPGPAATVRVRGGGLATSSTAARRWTRGGVALHHLVDPLTGLPAASPWRTVSVHAASCVDANTASTAAVVRGEGADRWLAGLGLPARLVTVDGAVRTVAGWPPDAAAPPRREEDG